jgi:hypothetical protein
MEKGTRNLLIISSLFALGGITYYLFFRRKYKALNVYSFGKSSDGKLFLYITTRTPQQIEEFVKNGNPASAIQEMKLAENPTKANLKIGTSVEVKGIEGLDGTYSVLGTLSPQTNSDRVMAVKIDATSVPSTYVNKSGATNDRFYASSAGSVGKLIIK